MAYHPEYDGYYRMRCHDDEVNALKRWFDNYKVNKDHWFASDCEWLVVKEVPAFTKRYKKRYICEIGDDGLGIKRVVVMDHTTPPAPLLTFAAKRKWEPPPEKSSAELRQVEEWYRMQRHGYIQERVPIWPKIRFYDDGPSAKTIREVEYTTRWVKRPQTYFKDEIEAPRKILTPPTLKHRRNV